MSINLNTVGVDGREKIMEIATAAPVFCYENEKIKNVIKKMVQTGYRRIPIVSRNKEVVGILTKSDILDAFLRREDFNEKISTIMNRDLITCDENDSIEYVLNKFKLSRRGGFPIVSEGKLVGMISERDFVKKISDITTNITVDEVMTTKPFFISPELSILDCLRAMVNTRYRRLPVVSNEELVGIIAAEDLLKYIHKNKYKFEALDEGADSVMIKNVLTINREVDLTTAVKKMMSNQIGDLLVVEENNKLEGIITERDILEEFEYKESS